MQKKSVFSIKKCKNTGSAQLWFAQPVVLCANVCASLSKKVEVAASQRAQFSNKGGPAVEHEPQISERLPVGLPMVQVHDSFDP